MELRLSLIKLAFRLIKGYSIFFVDGDTAYYVNDILIDMEMKEIILQCLHRRSEE